MEQKIQDIILQELCKLNEVLENKDLENPTQNTKLYGIGGVLDSLALVSFITDLEERLSDEFNTDIILANERAMSQKNSPFQSVSTLAKYIESLLR